MKRDLYIRQDHRIYDRLINARAHSGLRIESALSSLDVSTKRSNIKESLWLPKLLLFAVLIVFDDSILAKLEEILIGLWVMFPSPFFDLRFIGCARGSVVESAQAANC